MCMSVKLTCLLSIVIIADAIFAQERRIYRAMYYCTTETQLHAFMCGIHVVGACLLGYHCLRVDFKSQDVVMTANVFEPSIS